MNENRLYLDIHAIQTLPPSNANRDDTGSPKTAVYGGVTRARVSSQSWKRAMRKYFLDESGEDLGVRSLNVVKYVADMIMKKDPLVPEDVAFKKAEKIFNDANVKTAKGKTKALFFLGKKQAEALADAAIQGISDKKELNKIFSDNPAIDIALFGRMVADDPSLNEDASAQVAHAISTHGVQTEFDFYTAVDDLAPEDNAGAGMLGTVEYNSSTLYRYANVAVHELVRQLDDKDRAINTAKLFIEAFANSMPAGKVSTFANQTLPQMLLVNIRQDRPVNLVTAFENPVKAKCGNVEPSIERLLEEEKSVEKFVKKPFKSLLVVDGNMEVPDWAEEEDSISELLDDFGKAVKEIL
ncbi:type I-E CRISPR-associated protein Cas7/Cse4/CasC [bacterium]|uniref:Type I-E CRISPR-associated protein Cas7/Cse4/CasC n=1 Tax=Hornefia butyriciproducens TaxID=2652293 RepID=A0A6L5Y4X2_9FIRM|nr:type I-E CRISPR-associated protein Cas7/Cse4/CasC [Hornefia butyriciproducens]MCI6041983.1 type I-E CRISPR-associated protein Cas7/Cse4/CasC [bacterium]MST51082.1 type I-E CRISPR-associated protein Cas7/Cse4/CasC [Hornefia butyriciproducens]